MTTKKLINTPTLKHHGFSLIEIIITLSLLSILMANATPYFGQILDKNRNKAQGVQLHLSLSLARTYAITNSVDVVVCPAVTMQQKQCKPKNIANSNWQHGWLVFADNNRDGILNSSEELLQSKVLLKRQAVVFNQNGRLRFFPNGSARSAGFYLCNASQSSQRYIRLLHTGRTRISTQLTEIQAARCHAGLDA